MQDKVFPWRERSSGCFLEKKPAEEFGNSIGFYVVGKKKVVQSSRVKHRLIKNPVEHLWLSFLRK